MIIGEPCTCRVCGWNRSAGRNLDVPKPNQVVNPYTLSIPAKAFTFTTSGYSVISSPTPWSYGPTIT